MQQVSKVIGVDRGVGGLSCNAGEVFFIIDENKCKAQ
jgi:hypothetical protein